MSVYEDPPGAEPAALPGEPGAPRDPSGSRGGAGGAHAAAKSCFPRVPTCWQRCQPPALTRDSRPAGRGPGCPRAALTTIDLQDLADCCFLGPDAPPAGHPAAAQVRSFPRVAPRRLWRPHSTAARSRDAASPVGSAGACGWRAVGPDSGLEAGTLPAARLPASGSGPSRPAPAGGSPGGPLRRTRPGRLPRSPGAAAEHGAHRGPGGGARRSPGAGRGGEQVRAPGPLPAGP